MSKSKRGRGAQQPPPQSGGDPSDSDGGSGERFDGWLHFKHNFPDGRSAFDKEFDGLPKAIAAGYDELKKRVIEGTERPGAVKHIGDGIFELKNRQANNPYRLLYIKWGRYLVALTVFHKKDEKTSKALALTRKKRWLELSAKWKQ